MNQHTRMCTKIFIQKNPSTIVETSKNQNTNQSYLRCSFFWAFASHLSSYFPGFHILAHVLSPPRMRLKLFAPKCSE